jgi:structural maintenance of chromosomes protein 5
LNEARNEPSTEARSAELRQDILKRTKQRLKITKQYTVIIYIQNLPVSLMLFVQELMRSLIRDQAENTRIALEYVQVGANKAALDALCKEKDEQFQKALAEFNEGETIGPRSMSHA